MYIIHVHALCRFVKGWVWGHGGGDVYIRVIIIHCRQGIYYYGIGKRKLSEENPALECIASNDTFINTLSQRSIYLAFFSSYRSTWATVIPDRSKRSREMWLPLPLAVTNFLLICSQGVHIRRVVGHACLACFLGGCFGVPTA